MSDPTTIRRLYGRRQGHRLRAGQQALVEEFLPRLSVPATGPLDARTLFGDDRPLGLEIGFGRGEHLAAQAEAHPGIGFIGCEPFLDGVVGLLLHIRERGLANVRIHMGDAIEVLERLPDAALTAAWLLHPDPWPKARHAKRRFMNGGPIDLLAAKLASGARFRFGTDHPVYCRWAMMVMGQSPYFEWLATSPRDFLVRPDDWRAAGAAGRGTAPPPADFLFRPADWPETRYEAKARARGHELWYFDYERT